MFIFNAVLSCEMFFLAWPRLKIFLQRIKVRKQAPCLVHRLPTKGLNNASLITYSKKAKTQGTLKIPTHSPTHARFVLERRGVEGKDSMQLIFKVFFQIVCCSQSTLKSPHWSERKQNCKHSVSLFLYQHCLYLLYRSVRGAVRENTRGRGERQSIVQGRKSTVDSVSVCVCVYVYVCTCVSDRSHCP